MFFYIGKDCPIKSVNKVADNLFLDKGWKCKNIDGINYWYKGYSTECVLEDSISYIIGNNKPTGKWLVISENKDLYHPELRGCPVYKDDSGIKTNIPLPNLDADSYSTTNIHKFTNLSLEEASKYINEILEENIKNFLNYNKIEKLNVLFSAGIDTLTVWSIVDNLGLDYNLHITTPKVNNIFGVKQEYESDLIDLCRQNFWGYKMTSCYLKENWYITGFYSERVQLREVSQGHVIANYMGKKLYNIPNKEDYLYYFLQRPDCKENNYPTYDNEKDVLNWCNGSVFYDHQMWHIDNNYHFSPFNDLRITEVMNQVSLTDIVSNALNATIQKNIIKYNRPDFLQILSQYKNAGNIWANYKKNFSKIKLRENINKFIT